MGKMFGFTFPENFNYPYTASSIRDFWKRWHISLTSWFREYLYFPLGGNRKGKVRTMFNRFFVFLCTGIWHGANWTFIVWGIYHGILTIIETAVESRRKKYTGSADSTNASKALQGALGHIYTLLAVTIGFVIFRADTMGQAAAFIKNMFSFTRTQYGFMTASSVMSPLFIITMMIAAAASTPILKMAPQRKASLAAGRVCTIILYLLCIMEIAAGSYNPFIYFRF